MSTSPPQTAGPAYHHADLRAALLTAARPLLERAGPSALSLREVARRAGVSHNAPYRHFKDRAALLAALAAEGFDALAAAIRAAREAAPAERRLAAMGAAYVRFALDAPGLFRLMFGGAVRAQDNAGLAAAGARAFGELASETEGGTANRAPGAGDIRALAAWATVHGLAHLLLDVQIPAVRGDRAAAEQLVKAILGARTN